MRPAQIVNVGVVCRPLPADVRKIQVSEVVQIGGLSGIDLAGLENRLGTGVSLPGHFWAKLATKTQSKKKKNPKNRKRSIGKKKLLLRSENAPIKCIGVPTGGPNSPGSSFRNRRSNFLTRKVTQKRLFVFGSKSHFWGCFESL